MNASEVPVTASSNSTGGTLGVLDWAPSCFSVPSNDCYDVWREVRFLCVGTIIPLGLVLNTLALLVFVTSWMRNTVPGRYFMSLALADNLVLTGELLLWLNSTNSHGSRLGINFINTVQAMCRFVHWLRYGSRIWSSWVTVSITIERFLTVTYPLKMAAYSDPRKSTVIIGVEMLVCFGMSSFVFATLDLVDYKSRGLMCIYSHTMIYNVCNFVINCVVGELLIPSVIVLIFTLLIIRRLTKARLARMKVIEGQQQMSCLNSPRGREAQPTIALLAIAIMFVTIRLPYMITYIINDIHRHIVPLTGGAIYRLYIAYHVSYILAVTNYACNFLIFCLSGSTFRNELRRFVTCRCRRRRPYMSDITRSRSLSVDKTSRFHAVLGKGRSASVDILCHIGRKMSPYMTKTGSVERLQNPLLTIGLRSASVGQDKLLNYHKPFVNVNSLHTPLNQLQRSHARSLTADDFGLKESIPYMDDMS